MRQISTVLLVLLTLSYPFAIYFGLNYFDPRWLALLLVVLLIGRLLISWHDQQHSRWGMLLAIAVLLWAALSNQQIGLKLYPVIISFSMLALFAWSLYHPPSIIERLARRMEPEFTPEAVTYTRNVTQMWCGFFAINGLIALYTAVWGSMAQWTLYNGLLSYLIMGTLLAGEWLVRRRVKRAHHD